MELAQINLLLTRINQELKSKFTDEKFYNRYIDQQLIVQKFENNTIYIIIADQFGKKELENQWKKIYEEKFTSYLNIPIKIFFITKDEIVSDSDTSTTTTNNQASIKYQETLLNLHLTFENYIIGEFNSTSTRILKEFLKAEPAFNLIYLTGGVGHGKTHLLNAFGNLYFETHSSQKLVYYNNEEIYQQIYRIINDEQKIQEFKKKLFDYDLIMIDDIQQFVEKDRINNLFFALINDIINRKKKIIVASDKAPTQLIGIDVRNISRLSSQMMTTITRPKIEDIKKIIKDKFAKWNTYHLGHDAVEYLAMLVGGDIRKINGLYTTLSFNITTSDIPPNSVLTKDIVSQYFVNIQSEANKNIGINIDPLYPITIIANYFNESVNNVLSETRKNEIVKIRDICMYILNSEFHLKLVEIGNIFSNRAHSSVIEALKRVKRKMKNDRGYTETVNSIIKRVK